MVPNLMPSTRSIRKPPTMGRTTLGQQYQAYRLENWVVVMFKLVFISDWRAPGLS